MYNHQISQSADLYGQQSQWMTSLQPQYEIRDQQDYGTNRYTSRYHMHEHEKLHEALYGGEPSNPDYRIPFHNRPLVNGVVYHPYAQYRPSTVRQQQSRSHVLDDCGYAINGIDFSHGIKRGEHHHYHYKVFHKR